MDHCLHPDGAMQRKHPARWNRQVTEKKENRVLARFLL
jgi:hypothetical protein